MKRILILLLMLTLFTPIFSQSGKFLRKFTDATSGAAQTGSVIYIVNHSTGDSLLLTESPTKPGWYSRASVTYGEYKIYVDGSLSESNYLHGVVKIGNSNIADNAIDANKIQSGQVVKSLNGLTDNLTIQSGTNITVSSDGSSVITISSNGGGGGSGSGDITAVNAGSGLSGGGGSGDVTLFVGAGQITSSHIGSDAVDSDEIESNAVGSSEIDDNAVGSSEIATGAVGADELLSNSISPIKLNMNNFNSTHFERTFELDYIFQLKAGGVGATEIATNAVGSNEIAANAVGSSEIATDAITKDKIAINSVGSDELAGSAVGTIHLQNDIVYSNHIVAGAITASDIADSAITSSKLLADAVTKIKIADNAVDSSRIANSSILSENIKDGEIVAADIANGTITAAKIAGGQVVQNINGSSDGLNFNNSNTVEVTNPDAQTFLWEVKNNSVTATKLHADLKNERVDFDFYRKDMLPIAYGDSISAAASTLGLPVQSAAYSFPDTDTAAVIIHFYMPDSAIGDSCIFRFLFYKNLTGTGNFVLRIMGQEDKNGQASNNFRYTGATLDTINLSSQNNFVEATVKMTNSGLFNKGVNKILISRLGGHPADALTEAVHLFAVNVHFYIKRY